MARDAIQGYLAVLEEDGECLPPDVDTVAFDWGEAKEALVYRITVREATALPSSGQLQGEWRDRFRPRRLYAGVGRRSPQPRQQPGSGIDQ